MVYYFLPYHALIKKLQTSERRLAEEAELSRSCVRSVAQGTLASSLQSVVSVARSLNCHATVLIGEESGFADYSIVAISLKIQRDGFESWKTHLMDFVDEFRRTLDGRLILLGPVKGLDVRLQALLASTVQFLAAETSVPAPAWTLRRHFLEKPWFLSEMNSLKASALIESPLVFRRNNIFVHTNFLDRL